MSSRRELANAIRALSMDAVQKANSGHPGAPMGMADIAEVLWNDYMKHNPANPKWADRDRFVMSNGHGSMLVYSLLHLTGYDLPMEELKNFRQLHSKTPGHPEFGYTPGVETTTGPLGQGVTNAVGMAIAEKALAAQFNRDGHDVVDHYTYVFLGDGCLMEGISHEACSLAGTLGLGKLIAFYDDNGISIDGEVEGWFTDDTPKRFEAYGWHVVAGVDGHDADAVKKAIEEARSVADRPTIICCKTVIGWGAPNKQGKEECHGAPLGDDEIKLVRETIGWKHDPFVIPDDIYAGWNARDKGAKAEDAWNKRFAEYQKAHPELAAEFRRRMDGQLPADWQEKAAAYIKQTVEKAEKVASRKASQNAIGGYAPALPELLGGSADLAGSNLTLWKGSKGISREDADGNYLFYGVREFGMAAIMNGVALHGGFIPYGGTFLIFTDYARNGIRMSALTKQRVIYVLTHDSIGLGEDGPTHQPIEQVSSLRIIPNMSLWRPCDAVETAVAWKAGIERTAGPTSLILSRQGLPHQERSAEQVASIARGGYILRDTDGTPDAIIIATGSEVAIAMQAAESLSDKGRKVRVVSMPSTDVFDAQDDAYREAVLPPTVRARVAVEAGVTGFWLKYVGLDGRVVGIDRFGESAPGDALMKEFGFTADNVARAVEEVLA
ncbi:transketolase [Thioalkalivibrio denitrificans]|uniref:Transketolase n=1 Tax=Thioalkalivibrio denitrificans TaxID=108003 RepID=A0A1V3NTX8_9GAMM|nr:transketolase [Thioalkalivibrio denitrificans]OOG28567.1 transketolase [Thioalkalivibrio denitrificans]